MSMSKRSLLLAQHLPTVSARLSTAAFTFVVQRARTVSSSSAPYKQVLEPGADVERVQRVKYERGAAAAPGDATASDQPRSNDPAQCARTAAKGEPDWADAFAQVPEGQRLSQHEYPTKSAEPPAGAKDKLKSESLVDKAEGAVAVAADSIGEVAANAAKQVWDGSGREDRSHRPANPQLPGDYEAHHQRGRTVRDDGSKSSPTLK